MIRKIVVDIVVNLINIKEVEMQKEIIIIIIGKTKITATIVVEVVVVVVVKDLVKEEDKR